MKLSARAADSGAQRNFEQIAGVIASIPRIVYGNVDAAGVIEQAGSGDFSITRHGTGDYSITFDPPFPAIPTIAGITTIAVLVADRQEGSETPSSLRFQLRNTASAAVDSRFHVVVVGRRR